MAKNGHLDAEKSMTVETSFSAKEEEKAKTADKNNSTRRRSTRLGKTSLESPEAKESNDASQKMTERKPVEPEPVKKTAETQAPKVASKDSAQAEAQSMVRGGAHIAPGLDTKKSPTINNLDEEVKPPPNGGRQNKSAEGSQPHTQLQEPSVVLQTKAQGTSQANTTVQKRDVLQDGLDSTRSHSAGCGKCEAAGDNICSCPPISPSVRPILQSGRQGEEPITEVISTNTLGIVAAQVVKGNLTAAA